MDIFSALRQALGQSQATMATFFGLSRPAYALLEGGRRTVNAQTRLRLAGLVEAAAPLLAEPGPKEGTPPGPPPESLVAEKMAAAKAGCQARHKMLETVTEAENKHHRLEWLLSSLALAADSPVYQLIALSCREAAARRALLSKKSIQELAWELELKEMELRFWESKRHRL